MAIKKESTGTWRFWITALVSVVIFISTNIYLFGQFTGSINSHLQDKSVHQNQGQLEEQFLSEKEFEPYKKQLDRIESKIDEMNKYLLKGKK